jgi:hypothetical protein
MFKIVKRLFLDNSILLYVISIMLIIALSYYCSAWFHITIDIFNFSIELNYLLIPIAILFLIIIYKNFRGIKIKIKH